MDTIINLKNIVKAYETSELTTFALNGVNLQINTGDFISITGASGCGKSTLLTILGLLDTPTEGNYTLLGRDVSQLNTKELASIRNKYIGYVFQSFNLIDNLSVYDNIALPFLYSQERMPTEKMKERIKYISELLSISHRLNHYPNQLSGGQQQRVSIARALALDPGILLLDEPTGNLDSDNSKRLMDEICKLSEEGTTICLVTHEREYADRAKKLYKLADGKLI